VGLALLLREGLPGWLKAVDAVIRESVTQHTATAVRPPAPECPVGHSITPVSGVLRHDLTALLASLVLSTRRVNCCSPTEECVPCQ
jgi:hypothetical protein